MTHISNQTPPDNRGWVRTALGEGRVAIVELGADGAVRLGSADGAEHVLAGGGQRWLCQVSPTSMAGPVLPRQLATGFIKHGQSPRRLPACHGLAPSLHPLPPQKQAGVDGVLASGEGRDAAGAHRGGTSCGSLTATHRPLRTRLSDMAAYRECGGICPYSARISRRAA